MTTTSRATLQDVAARAGVSLKTASRAVNAEPYVSEQTRDKVLAAAAELGFRLNAGASQLARGVTSDVVGLVTGDLANPFYASLASGAESELREHGLQLTLASSDEDAAREAAIVEEFARRNVRAVLAVSTAEDQAHYATLTLRGIPAVFLDRAPRGVDADAILLENAEGGRDATAHLIAQGHRRIGFLGDFDRLPTFVERLAGYRRALDDAGLELDPTLVRSGAHDTATAARLTAELLEAEHPPTALFASNNRATIGALQAFARCGGPAPALVGFDDFDLAEVLGVTVVAHDPREMGRQAARAAIRRLDERASTPETVRMPTRLIPRGSGERRPA